MNGSEEKCREMTFHLMLRVLMARLTSIPTSGPREDLGAEVWGSPNMLVSSSSKDSTLPRGGSRNFINGGVRPMQTPKACRGVPRIFGGGGGAEICQTS